MRQLKRWEVTFFDKTENQEDALNWPQPWFANTAVIILPRMCVEANSEEMTADSG